MARWLISRQLGSLWELNKIKSEILSIVQREQSHTFLYLFQYHRLSSCLDVEIISVFQYLCIKNSVYLTPLNFTPWNGYWEVRIVLIKWCRGNGETALNGAENGREPNL